MFKPGNAGRPKGTKNSPALMAVKNLLEDAFVRNRSKAYEHIDAMFQDKQDFKFLLSLKASVEPKEINHGGEGFRALIIQYGEQNKKVIDVKR